MLRLPGLPYPADTLDLSHAPAPISRQVRRQLIRAEADAIAREARNGSLRRKSRQRAKPIKARYVRYSGNGGALYHPLAGAQRREFLAIMADIRATQDANAKREEKIQARLAKQVGSSKGLAR